MKQLLQFTLLLLATFSFGQTPIQVFNFENTMSNTTNTASFVGQGQNPAGNTSFSTGATGRLNSALSCAGGGTSYLATISNLPVGNSPRTISFWYRNDCTAFCAHRIFSYGAAASNQAYGANIGAGGLVNYGFGNDLTGNWSNQVQGQWYLYVCTFDGTNATIYRNGVQLATANKAGWNTAASTAFRLGASIDGTADLYGAIDDLKIYDVALSPAQVSAINNHRHANIVASATSMRENNITTTSATLNYRVDAGNLPTNVVLRYGTSAGVLNNIVTVQTGLVNAALTEYSYNLTGLNQSTSYYYTLTAENESGKTVLAERTFSTTVPFSAAGLVAYFPFENNFMSQDGNHSFTAVATAPGFTAGQVGQGVNFTNELTAGNSTALVNNSSLNASLTGSDYSLCFWVDPNYATTGNLSQYPTFAEFYAYAYVRQDLRTAGISRGLAATATSFRASTPVNQGPDINTNGLHHIALVHKSGTSANRVDAALYINGQFISTISTDADVSLLHRFNPKVFVGGGADGSGNESANKRFRGIIDELYIYNRALNASEILAVMFNTNQTLATTKLNIAQLNFNLYPNPANSILNIDVATEIKSVEIYSLQGQKVLVASSKEINVSNLSSGIYMVQVEDVNGAVAIQKLVKK